jgi:sugar phosphate isomerase/epimerase
MTDGAKPASELRDLSRLCVHTITTKPWDLDECIDRYAAAGVRGVSVWRNVLEGRRSERARGRLADAALAAVSVVRGGFFTAPDAERRRAALDDNRRAIDQAAALGAPLLVLVCGATPGQSVHQDLAQIRDGIEAVLPHAEAAGVKLSIEPLHPMYADTRSAVTTLKAANDLCDAIDADHLGVTVDVFHVWWDPELDDQIARAGLAGRILSFHVCDWKTEMADMLNDRGLMGEGIIDVRGIRGQVEAAGFNGFIEVEIFSDRWWAEDQQRFLDEIVRAYREHT